jgi:hypothetical protein
MTTYKEWLDSEYSAWVKALQESTIHNFKTHPTVQRMLSLDLPVDLFQGLVQDDLMKYKDAIMKISSIGTGFDMSDKENFPRYTIYGATLRMIYYARKVLDINPPAIREVGAGVGEFYAILRVMGYKGDYFIDDLPGIRLFQQSYFEEVEKQIDVSMNRFPNNNYEWMMFLSFYALGEFDDDLKYIYAHSTIPDCKHGLVLWNPHSGASEEIPFPCKVEDEFPKTGPNNKMLTW